MSRPHLALRGKLLIQQAVAAAENHLAGLLARPRARRRCALPVRAAFCRRCMHTSLSASLSAAACHFLAEEQHRFRL